jgi:hypothetical protein
VYRNPDVRKRSVERRIETTTTVANFMEHYAQAQGLAFKLPAETIAAILLIAADGFADAARVEDDAEALFATFLDLFVPAVMEEVPRITR